MNFRMLTLAAVAALLVNPVIGAEEEKAAKKRKRGAARQNVATALIKQLQEVGLTEDQTAQIKELGKKVAAEMKSAREEAGFTQELQKKLAEAQKSMKESDKKGKERMAAIHEAAGLSEAQIAAIKKVAEARQKFQKDVFALLTDEQKEKLPEKLSRAANRGGQRAKGDRKKKKDAA